MTDTFIHKLGIALLCIAPFYIISASRPNNAAANLLDVSDYFHDLFEDEKNSVELKKPFEQFLPKDFAISISHEAYKHFMYIIMYAKKHFSRSPNRYVLLQKIVKKLNMLYPANSNFKILHELYKLADFTGTNIIVNAIALYFIKNPSHIKKILPQNGGYAFLKKRIEFMHNVNMQMSMAVDDYIDAGILPVITHNVHILHPYTQASTLRDNAQDSLKTFKKNSKLPLRLNYLEQCLRLAPDHIAYKKLPALFKKDIEHLLTRELINAINPNLDLFFDHYTHKGLHIAAIKACYNYLQQMVINKQIFQNIFNNLTNPTLKYFCRYLFYIKNYPLYIDTIQTPYTWDQIANINNQKLDLDCLSKEQLHIHLPHILNLISVIAPDLTKISLADNLLLSLPIQICNLDNLRVLVLSKNALSILPSYIGKLIKLKRLNLDSNQLTFLPVEIGNLKNLKDLYLQENQLISLPEEFDILGKLTYLNLNNNQLTKLPTHINNLANLQDIELLSNQFNQEEQQKIKSLFPSKCKIYFE